MTKRQEEFHMQTHPGHGSYWDDHLQRCVYRKPTDEYNTSLPPPARLSPKTASQRKAKQESGKEKELPVAEEPFVIRAAFRPVILSIHSQEWNKHVDSNDILQTALPFTFGRGSGIDET